MTTRCHTRCHSRFRAHRSELWKLTRDPTCLFSATFKCLSSAITNPQRLHDVGENCRNSKLNVVFTKKTVQVFQSSLGCLWPHCCFSFRVCYWKHGLMHGIHLGSVLLEEKSNWGRLVFKLCFCLAQVVCLCCVKPLWYPGGPWAVWSKCFWTIYEL